MKIKSYKELIAYQKSYELVKAIYKITESFPKHEIYGLSSQIRRSAVSIPSNIAEGFMRGAKEYLQFLKIALGSSAELETQLCLAKDLGLCSDDMFKELHGIITEVMRLLSSYIAKLQKK